VVWDRSACIDFKKPGRTALFARFQIDGAELDTIRRELEQVRHVDRVYHVDLVDEQGTVHASVEKSCISEGRNKREVTGIKSLGKHRTSKEGYERDRKDKGEVVQDQDESHAS